MGKLIPFKPDQRRLDRESRRMMKVADEIDEVIIKYLEKEMSVKDLAGLLAHRLGTLMRNVKPSDRERLWQIVHDIVKERAEIEKVSDF